MKANLVNFSRLSQLAKQDHLRAFATHLVQKPGMHVITPDSPIERALLAKGVKNILVSNGATLEVLVAQLGQLLGLKNQGAVKEVAALFNVPEVLAGKGALLFNRGQVEQTTTAESQYTIITLSEVKKGLTDFGEEIIRFMELNHIETLEILTALTVPRYQKIGFSGAVYGDRLGMRDDVSSWNTVMVKIKDLGCIGCFKCVIACPAGAIKPVAAELVPITEVKKRGWERGKTPHPNRVTIEDDACKGCQLCVWACDTKPNAVEVTKKDA